jgi:leucyl aminopeptidase
MDVRVRHGDLVSARGGTVALGILEGMRTPSGAALAVDRASHGAIRRLLASGDFAGRALESAVVHPATGPFRRIVLVGLGPRERLDTDRVRLAGAVLARRTRELRAGSLITVAHGAGELDSTVAAQALIEGVVLGHYRFGRYRREPGPPPLRAVVLVERDAVLAKRLRSAVARGAAWAEATCLARDLVNTPAQDLTPEGLAARAREIGRAAGARVEVLGVPQLERLGMGALLAVGRGSTHPPRFIVLDRSPGGTKRAAPATPVVVLVGKGITFDSGGLALKPLDSMVRMKYDMSGAAAVLGAFSALPVLDPPVRVVALVPAAENMPGPASFRPGDVVRMLDGTTVEVTNTDAEGRLVLADALAYARRYSPAAVVDLATLTGAVRVALGPWAAGLFTDDDPLASALLDAGAAAGERLWRMPCWDEVAGALRSDTADLVNSAGRDGGAVIAAVFLKRFAAGLRWAHLDIASTAWSATERPHEPRGATGFGARLLLEWLSRRPWASASPPHA